ncbi:siderophore-interacting protein [Hansschlegelia sp.]|uniref:siderophore-interacting protein n=1 Tax=Hansschlegelia sp. TaxID=2041892 RepID=UPI002C3F58B7|nr:siderophore-interacting protein [Hansschlegelia sp.]HVI27444.1 siderophore-interacting protein [Hansschlegelia sp.]
MASLISRTEVTLPDPHRVASLLIEHMQEHDVLCELVDGRTLVDLGVGSGAIEVTATALKVELTAQDMGSLELLRAFVAEHVEEFCEGFTPTIAWRGNVAASDRIADFRELTLKSAVELTPKMRRLTFSGEDLARFDSREGIHVRLYFPPDGVAQPEWPRVGADGQIVWPPEERKPAVRYYTVRCVRPEAGEIDIDFVLHDDPGPGASFAVRAEPGAVCGMAGPVGKMAPQSGWTLLAGDETALPAIARTLELMPARARGTALIEVGGPSEEVRLEAPDGFEIRWLHRSAAPADGGSPLAQAVASALRPEADDAYAWVACEYGAAKEIRAHLRSAWKLARDRHMVVGYWERAPAA